MLLINYSKLHYHKHRVQKNLGVAIKHRRKSPTRTLEARPKSSVANDEIIIIRIIILEDVLLRAAWDAAVRQGQQPVPSVCARGPRSGESC